MSGSNDHRFNNGYNTNYSRDGGRNGATSGRTNGAASGDGRPPGGAFTNGDRSTDGALAAAGSNALLTGRLRVWIDQDLCTGDGICTDHAPDVFTILEDGIAYVREGGRTLNDPGGSAGLALVPVAREADVVDAAAECPGECIFVELEERPELTE
jgi:ferredoxin